MNLTRSRTEAASWWKPLAKYHYLPKFPAVMDYAIAAENDQGMIVIGYPARHSHMRGRVFPTLRTLPWSQQAAWLKANLRVLSRVVVHPDSRRKGLASHLIQQALQELPCPFLECYAHPQTCGDLFEKNGFRALYRNAPRAKIEGMPKMPGPEYWFWGGTG